MHINYNKTKTTFYDNLNYIEMQRRVEQPIFYEQQFIPNYSNKYNQHHHHQQQQQQQQSLAYQRECVKNSPPVNQHVNHVKHVPDYVNQHNYIKTNNNAFSPLISNVKNVWSSALYLPCLYPYLYEPSDYLYQPLPQSNQQQFSASSDLNALYEKLVSEDNDKKSQASVIRRLNYDYNSSSNSSSHSITSSESVTLNETNLIKSCESRSLSSDDGYQSGSFENFAEKFITKNENLAPITTTTATSRSASKKNSSKLADLTSTSNNVANSNLNRSKKNASKEQTFKDITNEEMYVNYTKIKFVAPRFQKLFEARQEQNKQQKHQSSSQKSSNYSNNYESSAYSNNNSNNKQQQQQTHTKRNNNQNISPNKYNKNQNNQTKTVDYTKRCKKCSLNFLLCACSGNGKTVLSPLNGTHKNNNNFKYSNKQ